MNISPPGRYRVVVAVVLLATLVRIANTHLTFAQTLDEPFHVASGHEWLTRGSYDLNPDHPPLPRALFALPFWSVSARQVTHPVEYGNDLFAHEDRYIHNVAKARRGNLLFVAIAALALAASARLLFGETTACVALLLFVSLPAVLAHGGLATTDMAGVAAFAMAFHALLRWSDAPSWPRSILLGACIGLGVVCKYSFPLFFAPAMLVTLIAKRRFHPRMLLAMAGVAALVTWGAFGFSLRTIASGGPNASAMARAAGIPDRWTHIPLPAPDLVVGFLTVRVHNHAGHPAYLLGRVSDIGWWYYFPIALAVKTPIPYLALALAGIWLLVKKRDPGRVLILAAAGILFIAMNARINIGVRHILPIFLPLSIIAAFAVVELWRTGRAARFVVIAALGWFLFTSARVHPDYIPWMNAFAGRNPQRTLLDSNYDWGQDIWRLARICRKRDITSLDYAVFTSVRPSSIGITGGAPLDEKVPTKNEWAVISEQNLELARVKNPGAYAWLERHPFERVGKTLRLYHWPRAN